MRVETINDMIKNEIERIYINTIGNNFIELLFNKAPQFNKTPIIGI